MQVVPNGIESVNGSDVNMGCTSPLVDRRGVMMCETMSHLVDGCSPDIDTSTSDWASQLVTVRSGTTSNFPLQHVLLTFGFDTAVSLTGIELDLFLCPEWKSGAPCITVYGENRSNLVFNYHSGLSIHCSRDLNQSACNSLSNVSIPLQDQLASSFYSTWHILVHQFGSSIDWVHVGEVRFLGSDVTPMICTVTASSSVMISTQCEQFLFTCTRCIPKRVSSKTFLCSCQIFTCFF